RSPSAALAAPPPPGPGRRTARPGYGTAGRRAVPAVRAARARAGRAAAAGPRRPARRPDPARIRSLASSRPRWSAQSPSVSDRDLRRIAHGRGPGRGKPRKARHDRGAMRGWWLYRPRTDTVTGVSDAVPGSRARPVDGYPGDRERGGLVSSR